MISTGKYFHWLVALFLVLPLSIAAQNGALKGTVTDSETLETLIGASVTIVGTYNGTVTDIDGNYEIKDIKPGDYSIKVSYVGYADKIFNGIRIEKGKTQTLNISLETRATSIQEVVIVGEKNLINLESGQSEIKISTEDIKEMNVRDVKDIVSMQNGVTQTADGIQIRGGRVYETQYLVDGISAQDPLAGTGFGVEVSSNSIQDLKLITGGAGAEYGDGSSGVISTSIREGGKKFAMSGSWQRDNFGSNQNQGASWNTDIVNLAMGTPIPFTKKKLTFFTSISLSLDDTYYRTQAKQLHSSLFTNNDSLWAPRQNNKYSHTTKFAYQIKPGTKLTLTNQHSLAINQNTRSLQIIGFDAVVRPGLQYAFSDNLDNANTYTHQSNLTILNFNHFFNNNWNFNLSAGRLFTNLRSDANGRPFREETVDQILDPESIVTDPITLFNPDDPVIFVFPGSGLYNNGGIATQWHDHYAQEHTIRTKFSYYPKNKHHTYSFGIEHKELEYQWVDVSRPWVGAPIKINDSLSTASISIGSFNDIWKVKPANGGIFVQDNLSYKGINATIGLRFNYWAYGKFVDNAVDNPDALVLDQVRQDYNSETSKVFGRRYKARFLPKLNISFPVTENNVLYFNYGHSMKLPHPRFIYAGLDPVFQDRSFLSRLGNPNLKPEATVSYEIGLKSQITRDLGLTLTAFNNDKYDYIVTRTIVIQDQTGRLVDKTFNINQDYAKIVGIELGIAQRIGKHFKAFFNGAYQVATGKSNSAAESLLQIRQDGFVNTTQEQPLAWDRPWDLKLGLIFTPDTSLHIGKVNLNGFRVFVSSTYKSGLRYTPYELAGTTDLGRPVYQQQSDKPFSEIGKAWNWTDIKISRDFLFKNKKGISLSIEIRNAFNQKNAQLINPVTGDAYQDGDPLPIDQRDPAFPDPQDFGVPPGNPARFLPPRQILYGLTFSF